MRGTILILFLVAICAAPGCSVFDMMLDASYDSVKKWGEEKLPILKSDLGQLALAEIGKVKEEMKEFTREKTKALADSLSAKVEARSGVPAPQAGETIGESFADMKRWWVDTQLENERRRLENERRESEGEEPGPRPMRWYEMVFYSFLGGGSLMLGGAANSRREKSKIDRRVTGYLRNIGVLPNGNGGGKPE